MQDIATGAMDRLQSFLPEFSQADGQATSALRFNEDLSTRPAWLPPDSGRPSLALARWWSSQPDQQTSLGASLKSLVLTFADLARTDSKEPFWGLCSKSLFCNRYPLCSSIQDHQQKSLCQRRCQHTARFDL